MPTALAEARQDWRAVLPVWVVELLDLPPTLPGWREGFERAGFPDDNTIICFFNSEQLPYAMTLNRWEADLIYGSRTGRIR